MASDENWDRFSGLSIAVLVSERLGVGYRYDLEPYLGKVSRIGGKPGQSRRVVGDAIRELFDSKWRMIVTRELGFESLAEMQQARASEVESMERERRNGDKGSGVNSTDRSKVRK
mmetsp:Transcript_80210/g.214879  ORF Transcript_80210/g.214879 Transcript_80210/m.214879 type:complete len:115 (-) Transcript_80210:2305-2649(-)